MQRGEVQPQTGIPELFRTAIDASPHGIALRQGHALVYSNAAWKNLSAKSSEGSEQSPELGVSSYDFEHGGQTYSVDLVHDVSRRREAERQVQEAQKLEALGRWVGGVVHDFNNVLTAIMLYSDMIAQGADPSSPVAQYNREINDVAKRGTGLTGQLLAFLQQRPYDCTVLSMNSLLKGLRDVLGRMIGEDVDIIFELAPESCDVRIDPAQVQQVVFNLVLNARDAMPSGGRLSIRTCELEADLGTGLQKCVRLEVADTGCGMDQATRLRIFEPFFTTKAKGKGTGLGLTAVRDIVTKAAGTVMVESEKDEGTVVSITLPRIERPTAVGISNVQNQEFSGGSESVLLVEDDPAVRSSVAQALAGHGYRVLQAARGDEALNLAGEFPDKIDLVITDIVLPGISGRDLVRRLQESRPEIRVLLISGYAALPETSYKDAVFQKPFDTEALAGRVRQVLSVDAATKSR